MGIQPDDRDLRIVAMIAGFDRVECRHAGGIPDLGVRQIDGDVLRVLRIKKVLEEIVTAAEEERRVPCSAPTARLRSPDAPRE